MAWPGSLPPSPSTLYLLGLCSSYPFPINSTFIIFYIHTYIRQQRKPYFYQFFVVLYNTIHYTRQAFDLESIRRLSNHDKSWHGSSQNTSHHIKMLSPEGERTLLSICTHWAGESGGAYKEWECVIVTKPTISTRSGSSSNSMCHVEFSLV